MAAEAAGIRRFDCELPDAGSVGYGGIMQYRPLGTTGIAISAVSFGAGPVSGLMTAPESRRQQRAVIERALELGINWFDTAATYGAGESETSLGCALQELAATSRVHLATKVRLMPEHLHDIKRAVRASVRESLARLQVDRVTLLQLHNSITARRGDEPTSLTPEDVLGPGGVLEAFDELVSAGTVAHLGLTGIGQPEALRAVIRSGRFATMQVPYHLLNPSAGRSVAASFSETDYGNIIADCAAEQMGVLAIRVFAAGALLGNSPSAHTRKTPFFPLALYERDVLRASALAAELPPSISLREAAVRYVLGHPSVTSALIGFGEPAHVDASVNAMRAGPLPADTQRAIDSFVDAHG